MQYRLFDKPLKQNSVHLACPKGKGPNTCRWLVMREYNPYRTYFLIPLLRRSKNIEVAGPECYINLNELDTSNKMPQHHQNLCVNVYIYIHIYIYICLCKPIRPWNRLRNNETRFRQTRAPGGRGFCTIQGATDRLCPAYRRFGGLEFRG